MKERKNVKISVNMFDDTKLKIIDTKPERDLINYIWFRLVTLAGKVNRDGELYLSKNIPYTPETFAIEFNRGTYQINLALDVLIELEMIEIIDKNVYKVKNFVKHQGTNKNPQNRKAVHDNKENSCSVKNIDEISKDIKTSQSTENTICNDTTKDTNIVSEKTNITKTKDNLLKISDKEINNNNNNNKTARKRQSKMKKSLTHKIKTSDINEQIYEEEPITFYDGEIEIKNGTVINSWNF